MTQQCSSTNKPIELSYQVAREVGLLLKPSRQFKQFLCSGAGTSHMDWRD